MTVKIFLICVVCTGCLGQPPTKTAKDHFQSEAIRVDTELIGSIGSIKYKMDGIWYTVYILYGLDSEWIQLWWFSPVHGNDEMGMRTRVDFLTRDGSKYFVYPLSPTNKNGISKINLQEIQQQIIIANLKRQNRE